MTKIAVSAIQAEIVAAVRDYTEEVTAAIEKEILRTANQTVKDVKAASPVGVTGKYKKGWARRKIKSANSLGYTIYNRYKGPLVHILELGYTPHGATNRVPGRPHLRPAAEKNIDEMVKNIERIVREGG